LKGACLPCNAAQREQGFSSAIEGEAAGAYVARTTQKEAIMASIKRRSTLALGLGAASLLVLRTPSAEAAVGEEKELVKGVKQKILSEGPAIIPGYSRVSMRDIIVEPGATTPNNPMMNAMVCHITQGELKVTQNGQDFVAKKDHVWTCAKGTTTEGVTNTGTTVAIMRITDLYET
jgi:quercetin dioxygenase-like cupin family protein